MTTGQIAESYLKEYYRSKGTELIKKPKNELGFDFRDKDSNLFIEVKGTTAKDVTEALFRYFTNTEYVMAQYCRRSKKDYYIHLVAGIGTATIRHYLIPGKLLLERGRPEVSWWLPLRKDLRQYEIPSD